MKSRPISSEYQEVNKYFSDDLCFSDFLKVIVVSMSDSLRMNYFKDPLRSLFVKILLKSLSCKKNGLKLLKMYKLCIPIPKYIMSCAYNTHTIYTLIGSSLSIKCVIC